MKDYVERPGDLLPAGVLSLEILTNPSASILVTCSSYSLLLLSMHSITGWIPQDSLICWLLILSIFVLPTIFTEIVLQEVKDSLIG